MRPRIKTVEERIVDKLVALHGFDRRTAWNKLKEREMNFQMQFVGQS